MMMGTLDVPRRSTSRSHSINSNVRKTFQLLDLDGDGLISCQDLSRGLQSLDPTLTSTDLQTIVQTLDQGQTGTIDYKSFQTGFQKFLVDRKQRKGSKVDSEELSSLSGSGFHTGDAMDPIDEDVLDAGREQAIKQELSEQFQAYAQENGEDAITQPQFETLLQGYLGKLTEEQDENDIAEQLQSIWSELPKTKSGRITYASMLNALMGESGGNSPSHSARVLQPMMIPTTPNSRDNRRHTWDDGLDKRRHTYDDGKHKTGVLHRLLKQGPLSPIRPDGGRISWIKPSHTTSIMSPVNGTVPTSLYTNGLDDTMIHHGDDTWNKKPSTTIHLSASQDMEDSKHCQDTPQKQTNINHLLSTLESPVSNITSTTDFFTPTRSTLTSPLSPEEITPKFRPSRKQMESIDWDGIKEHVNEQQLQNIMITCVGRLLTEQELSDIHRMLLIRHMDVIPRDLIQDVIHHIKQQKMYGKNGTPKYGSPHGERSSADPVEAFAAALSGSPIPGTARQRYGEIDMEEMASVIAVNRKLLADSQKTVSHISLLKSRHDQLDTANSNLMAQVADLEEQISRYISERDEAQAQTRLIQAKLTVAEQQLKDTTNKPKSEEHDKLSALYMSAIEKQCKQEIELVHHSEQLQKSERENAAYQIKIKQLEKEMETREKTHQELVRQLRAENASLWDKNAELEQENRDLLRIQASLVHNMDEGNIPNLRQDRPLSEQLAEVAEEDNTPTHTRRPTYLSPTHKHHPTRSAAYSMSVKGLTIHGDKEPEPDPLLLQKLLTYQNKIKQLELAVQSREQEIEYLKGQIILWSPEQPPSQPSRPTSPVHMPALPEHDPNESLRQQIDALTKKTESLQAEIDRLKKENQEMAKILAQCCNGAKCVIC